MMKIINYFKASFSRKIARRVFKKYGFRIDHFTLSKDGEIEFANWYNPLIKPYVITQEGIDFFRELFPSGSFAIDVGAHLGSQTVPMALATGPDGIVLAFEPNPVVFEGLEQNARLNAGKYNITALQLGVADKDDEFLYASSEASISNGGLISGKNDNSLGKHKLKDTVKAVKLSAYLDKHYNSLLPKLALIKIDTEGFDLAILKDLVPVLRKYHPIVITEVFHSKAKSLTKAEREEMFSLLDGSGYSLYNVENFEVDASLKDVTRIPLLKREDMPSGHTYNILAIPKP